MSIKKLESYDACNGKYLRKGLGGGKMSKFEVYEAMAVASLIPIDRVG